MCPLKEKMRVKLKHLYRMQNELEDASPYSLVDMVDRNVEISED